MSMVDTLKPRVVFQDRDVRVVKRPRAHQFAPSEPALYDIERRTTDSLGNDAWHLDQCISTKDGDSNARLFVTLLEAHDELNARIKGLEK